MLQKVTHTIRLCNPVTRNTIQRSQRVRSCSIEKEINPFSYSWVNAEMYTPQQKLHFIDSPDPKIIQIRTHTHTRTCTCTCTCTHADKHTHILDRNTKLKWRWTKNADWRFMFILYFYIFLFIWLKKTISHAQLIIFHNYITQKLIWKDKFSIGNTISVS